MRILAIKRLAAIGAFSALCACGGGGSSSTSLPAHPASGSGVLLSITLNRTPSSSGTRNVQSLPPSAKSVDMKIYAGANTSVSPAATVCGAISGSSVTLSLNAPVGIDSLVITSYDGVCTGSGGAGTTGSGNALTQFSGTGNVMPTSSNANTVFNAGQSFVLSPITAPGIGPSNISWTTIGPTYGSNSGKLNAFVQSPTNPNIMYVGGGYGTGDEVVTQTGVFGTTDGGASWVPMNTGLTDTVINDLWMDPATPTNLLAATGITGIFSSTNGGATWTPVFSGAPVTQIVSVGSTLYACASTGLYKSNDHGATWNLAQSLAGLNSMSIVGGYTYLGTGNGTVMVSSGGAFTAAGAIPGGGSARAIHFLAADPASPTTVYASVTVVTSFVTQNLYKSTDAGTTWTQVSLPSGIRGAQVMGFDPVTAHALYVGGVQLQKTLDGGATFSLITSQAGDERRLYIGNGTFTIPSDQGVYSCTVSSCSQLTAGLSNNVVNDIGVGNTLVATIQDYSPATSDTNGAGWETVQGAFSEDGPVFVNAAQPSVCYAADAGGFEVSNDGCRTFALANVLDAGTFTPYENLNSIAPDTQQPNVVYETTPSGPYVSTNWGLNFAATGWPFTTASTIVVDPKNSRHILVADGSVHVSTNGGLTWSTATGITPNNSCCFSSYGSATLLAVNPANGMNVVAVLPAYGAIFSSTDGGQTFAAQTYPVTTYASRMPRWMSAQLQDGTPRQFAAGQVFTGYANSLKYSPTGSVPYLTLSTSRGLFISSDNGTSWQEISGNSITHMFGGVAWKNGYLYAATKGQGVLFSRAVVQQSVKRQH